MIFLKFINTIKYLKWQQFIYRLSKKFLKPRVTDTFNNFYPQTKSKWIHVTLFKEKINSEGIANFLNQTNKLCFPSDWNNTNYSKLWLYNLHYFDDLLSDGASRKYASHQSLLCKWIDENPVGYGVGWEPYPTSLRIVNILKAWLGGLPLNEKIFRSIFMQASYLSNDTEKHILGNHYFANLKALLFAGVIFENKRWIKIAEVGLLYEIPEQILADGSNFELSPMYHSIMLVDMLDLCNLTKTYDGVVCSELISLIENNIPKMINFLESMVHPDGGLSFFNDSVDGIAPSLDIIKNYAEKLELKILNNNFNQTKIIDNSASGYMTAKVGLGKLIFDASPIGPDYIPAHAHADTLSFELSLDKQRVLVNSGISEYGLSKNRINQRKTKAHNTVEIDGNDSSQIWSGFRVGNRARITKRSQALGGDNSIFLTAEHDGYLGMFGGCKHKRTIKFDNNSLIVNDLIDGKFSRAIAYFYFHPQHEIYISCDTLHVVGSKFLMFVDLSSLNYSINESKYHPEFGISESNKLLCIEFKDNNLEVCFNWIFQ